MIIGSVELAPFAANANQPGSFVHWSIFQISVANLVVVAVMVALFGAALLIPFPGGKLIEAEAADVTAVGDPAATVELEGNRPSDGTANLWTARLRRRWMRSLPPSKLLPDSQPAYVASWIYVFGVGALAALAVIVGSGFALALGGPNWWHYDSVGHFFNSLHVWSVELFMALLVIHLWGKFWMAAWRGRRTMTWITGVVAFLAAIVECFTGYLSQSNFDAQWISTSGKDAFNAAGVGAFFNPMDVGQMLMWHIVLIPIVLIALVGAHVLLVRLHGVSHPIGAHADEVTETNPRLRKRALAAADAAPWRGATRRYDILKEGTIAALIVLAVTFVLAATLSSPDVPPVTVATWARLAPADFLATSASELNGTSETATYGPPYNNASGSTQQLLFAPAKIAGVTQSVNAARDFVLGPQATLATTDSAIAAPLAIYNSASPAQQLKWVTAYATAVTKVTFIGSIPKVPAANDGPVPALLANHLVLARSGALDTDLLSQGTFYGTNYTRPLLYIEDGAYFVNKATAMGLSGSQWGVMNETGNYPGQPWLWIYTLWYQVPGLSSSANIDLIAVYLTGLATILLLAIPFIPGLRDIPRLIPMHRLIWRNGKTPPPGPNPADNQPPTGPPATTRSIPTNIQEPTHAGVTVTPE